MIRQGDASLKCIAFGMASLDTQLSPGTVIDLAVEPSINEFNGRRNVELQVRDIACR